MDETYYAYLIRFQRMEDLSRWRATLRNAQTGEVLRFADEKACLHYLLNMLHGNVPSESPKNLDSVKNSNL